MNRWRTSILLMLLGSPVLLFMGVGAWTLWEAGHLLWLWFSLPVTWGLAYWLAKLWRQQLLPLESPELKPSLHWTPRDQQAWKIVESHVQAASTIDSEEFTSLPFYLSTAQTVSEEIAQYYHPKATDPFGSLTIPEILSAAQLALEDLSEIYEQYIPGGQLITVNHWRKISKIPKHYNTVSKVSLAASAVFSPLATIGRYVASKTILAPVIDQFKANALSWFFKSFLQRVGFYAIEMNSGRLRGGVQAFRDASDQLNRPKDKPWDWFTKSASPQSTSENGQPTAEEIVSEETRTEETVAEETASEQTAAEPTEETTKETAPASKKNITISMVGQSGAGQTTLASLFYRHHLFQHGDDEMGDGEMNDAQSPVSIRVPKTSAVKQYELCSPDATEKIMLLETSGYATAESDTPSDSNATSNSNTTPKKHQQLDKDLQRILPTSDMILLTLDITSSARETDLQFLNTLAAWYEEHPHFKLPPLIVVLTHIDLLQPAAEWEPPYNWGQPTSEKEKSVQAAVENCRAELAKTTWQAPIEAVVPICSDLNSSDVKQQRVFGFQEQLLPAISAAFDKAAACGVVRELHSAIDSGKFRRVLSQIANVGRALRKRSS